MQLTVSGLDWVVILAYLAGVVGIGCYAGFIRWRGGGDADVLGGAELDGDVAGVVKENTPPHGWCSGVLECLKGVRSERVAESELDLPGAARAGDLAEVR